MSGAKRKSSWLKWVVLMGTVIAGLFFFVYPNGSSINTNCLPQPGFTCLVSYYNGNYFNVTIRQDSGINWTAANIIYLPQGQSPPILPVGSSGFCEGSESTSLNANAFYGIGILCPNPKNGLYLLNSGENINLVFTSHSSQPIGPSRAASGTLEAYYQINNNTWHHALIGYVTISSR